MSDASSFVPIGGRDVAAPRPRDDNPARGFANGILLALPLWALIGLVIWAIV